MKKIFAILVLILAGCDDNDRATWDSSEETKEIRQMNLKVGKVMGDLPDGRVVTRYMIHNKYGHDHWIYVVDGTRSMSNNFTTQEGKSNANNVMVMIDGIEYVPKAESPVQKD